jgi:hypothetical protein
VLRQKPRGLSLHGSATVTTSHALPRPVLLCRGGPVHVPGSADSPGGTGRWASVVSSGSKPTVLEACPRNAGTCTHLLHRATLGTHWARDSLSPAGDHGKGPIPSSETQLSLYAWPAWKIGRTPRQVTSGNLGAGRRVRRGQWWAGSRPACTSEILGHQIPAGLVSSPWW